MKPFSRDETVPARGRALGHTGGTLDKLESMPGCCTAPDSPTHEIGDAPPPARAVLVECVAAAGERGTGRGGAFITAKGAKGAKV